MRVLWRPTVLVYSASLLVYLVVGYLLAVHEGFALGDALSRVQSAQGVLLSRDPHLASIGFIFTPMTAMVEIPLAALSSWFPALTRFGVAGVIMSSVFMAGAAVQIWAIGADRGVPRWQQVAITVLFTVNPMIVFYGATGMSEAPFVFLMCWAARRLIRWTSTDDVHDLIAAGVALGLAYLARYDAAAPIGVGALFVAWVTWRRTTEHRWQTALLDAVILAAPGALAFFAWAATSWLLTGEAFAQFSSVYGNTQILEQSGGAADYGSSALAYSLAELLVLAPALPLLVPAVIVLARSRRDLEVVAATLMFGSVLAFQIATYVMGSTFPFLRFYICVIPLLCIYALQVSPARGQISARRPGVFATPRQTRGPALRAVAVGATLLVAVGLPITAIGMESRSLSVQQYAIGALLPFDPQTGTDQDRQLRILATYSTERAIADHLDSMDLPEGSILMDTLYGFPIVAASKYPERFVLPSDRDYVTILGDPAAHGVQYILTVPNSGRGTSDAVNRRYPTIYDNGAQIAMLEAEIPNDGADQPDWRLYRVLESATSSE
ncbi:ArnT family glycosyltransferase [Rhodococcus sp. NPDC003318]|uniref:ArnT family glycosyltransferase n=1 Tax=Rhodococcus sp. NPDC003318 TaxID=3364503 RepID=UPI00369C6CBD